MQANYSKRKKKQLITFAQGIPGDIQLETITSELPLKKINKERNKHMARLS
jgi:hypothetical protein